MSRRICKASAAGKKPSMTISGALDIAAPERRAEPTHLVISTGDNRPGRYCGAGACLFAEWFIIDILIGSPVSDGTTEPKADHQAPRTQGAGPAERRCAAPALAAQHRARPRHCRGIDAPGHIKGRGTARPDQGNR